MELGFTPKTVVFSSETALLGLAICGVLSPEEALKIIAGPTHLQGMVLKRPKICFYDGVNGRRIDPLYIEGSYITALTEALSPSPKVLNLYRAKARKCQKYQFTFKKYLKEWQEVCLPFGLNIERWLSTDEGSSGEERADLQAQLLFLVIIECCLRRLNQKWELADQSVFPEPRFLELCDLVVDEAISKTELVQVLTNSVPELEALAAQINSRQGRIDKQKPYPLLKAHNQALVELGDVDAWLKRVLSLPSGGTIADNGGYHAIGCG